VRSLSEVTVQATPIRVRRASPVKTSSRGPRTVRSTGSGSTGGVGATCRNGSPSAWSPTGRRVPSSSRGGPTGARVSVERLPSTGVTPMPPRTAR
jgi:hypothetical protein